MSTVSTKSAYFAHWRRAQESGAKPLKFTRFVAIVWSIIAYSVKHKSK